MRLQSTLREEERKKKFRKSIKPKANFSYIHHFICKSLILPFHANKEKRKKKFTLRGSLVKHGQRAVVSSTETKIKTNKKMQINKREHETRDLPQ